MALVGLAVEDIAWSRCSLVFGCRRVTHSALKQGDALLGCLLPRDGFVDSVEPLEHCGSCGHISRTLVPSRTGSRGTHKVQCCSCWLAFDGGAGEPLEELSQINGCEEFLRQLLMHRMAPFAPNNKEDPRSVSPGPPSRRDWPGRRIPLDTSARLTVLWDAHDRRSASQARALCHEFPGLCTFLEVHDPALDTLLLARHPKLLDSRSRLCRKGGLSAVLESGVFITGCEVEPKVLLFELLYRLTVRLPEEQDVARLQASYFNPLDQMRSMANEQARWWIAPGALRLVTASLSRNKFALIDGFLQDVQVQLLRETAHWFFEAQQMRAGLEEQRGGYGGYWGDGNDGDFQNKEALPRKWAIEGDFRAWVSDRDARAHCLRHLTEAVDALISALREGHGDGSDEEVTARLRTVNFRENTMVACYPGESRGKYLRHCDTGRGAALTVIFYLNESWGPQDGGELRLYDEGFHNTQVKIDIAPVANRLLLFWATEECPHEVLPTLRDRFAMTIWYGGCAAGLGGGGDKGWPV